MSILKVLGIGAAGAAIGIGGTLAYQKYVSGEESAEEFRDIASKLEEIAEKKETAARRTSRRAPAKKAAPKKAAPRKRTTAKK